MGSFLKRKNALTVCEKRSDSLWKTLFSFVFEYFFFFSFITSNMKAKTKDLVQTLSSLYKKPPKNIWYDFLKMQTWPQSTRKELQFLPKILITCSGWEDKILHLLKTNAEHMVWQNESKMFNWKLNCVKLCEMCEIKNFSAFSLLFKNLYTQEK